MQTMPRRRQHEPRKTRTERDFDTKLRWQKQLWQVGTTGAASDVRRLDPKTGQVIETISARKLVLPQHERLHPSLCPDG